MVTANRYGLLWLQPKLLTLRDLYALLVSLYIHSVASKDNSRGNCYSYGFLWL